MPKGVYERKLIPVKDRLLNMCIPVPESGCWLFLGSLNKQGYGQISVSTNNCQLAHRVSYEIFKGYFPENMFVLHTCDIPCCVNPDHLWLGDQANNMADMAKKGRSGTKGTKNPISKLTENDIRKIRASSETGVVLAERFGIAESNVSVIRNNHTWKHVQ